MRITKVYTRTGDGGTTRLVGGAEVSKDDPRIEAYGTVDELNSVLGVVRSFLPDEPWGARLDAVLGDVQDDLFNVGTELATPTDARWEGMYRLGGPEVDRLETTIDELNEVLPPLSEFVLPGGGRVGAFLHQARTVCRRSERRALALVQEQPDLADSSLRYLNRLSDLLFVAARWAAHQSGQAEVTWRNPANRARSGASASEG
ncbi:MAG: cob(I)yrinic acid a,c-diamide adenosyltransferase [Myxococcota bacterium]